MACAVPTQMSTHANNSHTYYNPTKPFLKSLSWRNSISSQVFHSHSTAPSVANLAPGTPVRPTSILVVGATGTLGRQIVKRALDEGYDVRCLVWPRPAPADFLRDWGATVVDWEGKVSLIQCAKAMGIQKYIFFSIHNCDKHPEVPLMEIKYCTVKFLKDSGINHITIRLCGFMQVLTLCERLAGRDANVTTVPVSVLRVTRQITRLLEWTNAAADRLAFSEVLSSDMVFSTPMNETYSLLGVDQKDIITLEKYLQDYFSNILKKLKDLKAQSKQTDIFF